jgi:hypothetical protein
MIGRFWIFDPTLSAGGGRGLSNLPVINTRAPFSISRQTNNDHLINAQHWSIRARIRLLLSQKHLMTH